VTAPRERKQIAQRIGQTLRRFCERANENQIDIVRQFIDQIFVAREADECHVVSVLCSHHHCHDLRHDADEIRIMTREYNPARDPW